MFTGNDEVAGLLRLATSHADAGDWGIISIATLFAARERMLVSQTIYPMETWCRLPLYLSRAGRFDEAIAEFDWLLADLPRRADKESGIDEPDEFGDQKARRQQLRDIILLEGGKVIRRKLAVVARRKAASAGR